MERPTWPFELKLLAWGAESNLYISNYLGKKVVIKHRFRKQYMIKELAERLIRERTLTEARILLSANQIGVKAPLPLFIDIDNGILVMEFIDGIILRDVILSLEKSVLEKIARLLGLYVAHLHNNDIIHGDLTTSNVVLYDRDIYLIDFGLAFFSNRSTDKASDIRVLERAIVSSHPRIFYEFFPYFLESYEDNVENGEEILKEFLKLSTMGRYYKKRFL